MFDIVIRNGTVIDGSGAAPFPADVAISGGMIAEIGKDLGPTHREIDADGAIITPGFIDVHTHYDGQFIWDNVLEPSFSNGVTTAISGNCGVGFAPVNKPFRHKLIEMMEGVEDIPGIVLDEGIDWDWTTFPDYLDRLDRREYTMDIASFIAHAPLRVFVMGERALSHEPATPEDIAVMQQLVREAMAAGAVGVSGSRILEHLSSKGEHVPGTFADEGELVSLARAMGESERGIFQIVPHGTAGDTMGTQISAAERMDEHERIVRIAEASGRPVTYLLHAHNHAPDQWRELVAASDEANERGLSIRPQIGARGLGMLLNLDGSHIFKKRPSYMEIAHLDRPERAAAMREPSRRAAILGEEDVQDEEKPVRMIHPDKILKRYYAMEPELDYEPDKTKRMDVIAARTGQTMSEVFYDLISKDEGEGIAIYFAMNYTGGSLDAVHDMLVHPHTISGLGDGGAHLKSICDAAMTTFHLSFWSRDRTRGPKLPIELMVAKLTGQPAEAYGLRDRGLLRKGMRADVNVINFQQLGNDLPEMVFDLPLGSGRYIQNSHGYVATLVNGVVTRSGDKDTGARPGRLIRMH